MTASSVKFGIVVIGRNEGDRLKRCIASLPSDTTVVYIDSGSTDGSPQWVRARGINVVDLEMQSGFTAARARNVGFFRLLELAPDTKYVQFVDGDCELDSSWPGAAISFLEKNAQAGAVFGRRRERYPSRSVYNWLCDLEWNTPTGESKAFGGDVFMRVSAFQAVGGYRNDVIAGEDPELGIRLRAAQWKLFRLDQEMTLHDAAITRFSQWWRRSVRSGYAFALGAELHGAPPERHWVWEYTSHLDLGGLAAGALHCERSSLWSYWPFGLVDLPASGIAAGFASTRLGPRANSHRVFPNSLRKFPRVGGRSNTFVITY